MTREKDQKLRRRKRRVNKFGKSWAKITQAPARLWIVLIMLGSVISGCQVSPDRPTPSLTPTRTATATPSPAPLPEGTVAQTKEQIISTPTPAPTATPSQLDIVVETISHRAGLDDLSLFGMNGENIVNLLISILIVGLGSLLGVLIVNGVHWLAKNTPLRFGGRLISVIQRQVQWLIALFLLQFATARLAFLPPATKQRLDLIYFAFFVLTITSLAWKLFDYGFDNILLSVSSLQNRTMMGALAPFLRRSIQVILYLAGIAIILKNFGVNLSALFAILGLGGLAVSLAAKQTLEDMISGFIILIDRPFQIGDRIKISTMDTWGDVETVGSRTTRIRTLDNRLVVIPNSVIVSSQIETYTYSNPSYRILLKLGISYGADIEKTLQIIKQAILSVPGVLESKPPVVDFIEFGDSAMIFRAIYWLESYNNLSPRTQVNKAISQALMAANIEMPFTTYDINLTYKAPPDTGSASNAIDSGFSQ